MSYPNLQYSGQSEDNGESKQLKSFIRVQQYANVSCGAMCDGCQYLVL